MRFSGVPHRHSTEMCVVGTQLVGRLRPYLHTARVVEGLVVDDAVPDYLLFTDTALLLGVLVRVRQVLGLGRWGESGGRHLTSP